MPPSRGNSETSNVRQAGAGWPIAEQPARSKVPSSADTRDDVVPAFGRRVLWPPAAAAGGDAGAPSVRAPGREPKAGDPDPAIHDAPPGGAKERFGHRM